MSVVCDYCGVQNAEGTFLCTQCGAPLRPAEKPSLVQRALSVIVPAAVMVAGGGITIVDTNHWNGRMTWELTKLMADGAIIKATEGTSVLDDQFEYSRDATNDLEIPQAYYHFWRPQPNAQNAKKQAQWFADHLNGDYGKLGIPFLDCEFSNNMSKQDLLNAIIKFMLEFYRITGKELGIYTRASWWDVYMPRTDLAYYTNVHKPRPWWLAQYNQYIKAPVMPKDLTAINNPVEWLLWQYSADGNGLGPSYGAQSKSIGLSRFNGMIADFNKMFGLNIQHNDTPPPPDPEPEPEPIPVNTNWIEITSLTNARIRPDYTTTATDIGDIQPGKQLERIGSTPDGQWEICKLYVWAKNTKPIEK